jgi:hypothetical protein
MTTPAALTRLQDIGNFILAGNAIFTLVSKKTGARKTFEAVQVPPKPGFDKPGYVVRLLTGPENTSDYRYLGFMYTGRQGIGFKLNHDGWGEEAGSVFSWFLRRLNAGNEIDLLSQAEFWHAGRCGRCGHLLTDPESIARGLGPVCAEK